MRALRVAIIGAGYWGPNLLRNFSASPNWAASWLVDIDDRRLRLFAAQYPNLQTTGDYRTVLADPQVDAIAIATPVQTHFSLAREALSAGKHVLVEKPFTSTVAEAQQLCALAAKHERVLMVDHTFLYTGAVEKLRSLVEEGAFGRLLYIDSVRVNLGLFQDSGNVVHDLAPHDISIINYVLGEYPASVAVQSASCIHPDVADVAFVTLRYPSGVMAHAHLSWLSPVKVRRLTVAGTSQMALWDDVEVSEKLKLYDKGVDLNPNIESSRTRNVSYRTGDVHSPALDAAEALAKLVNAFAASIRGGDALRCTGADGLAVVSVLEACDKSLATNGTFVNI